MRANMKVSVIVPIYKVEPFIERCVRSLFEQTLEGVEYIFVDDASPDNSVAILQKQLQNFPEKKQNVKIIRHKKNQGLPTARNSGLKEARGEYVFHCDSDDYMTPAALAEMYSVACEQNADFVWCDYYLAFDNSKRYMHQASYSTPRMALIRMLAGEMKYNVWNKLVKRNLYIEHDISFPEGYGMAEDMTMIRLMACAQQVAYVPSALYYYCKHDGEAFTNTWHEQHIASLLHNTNVTVNFLRQYFGNSIDTEIEWFKLNAKLPFLITSDRHLYKLWSQCYPESNRYIWSNKHISWRIRALQTLAEKHCFCLVRLYFFVIYKFIYGVVFK